MALVETAPHNSNLTNNIRMACADELAAQNLYRDLRDQVYHRTEEEFPTGTKEDILRRLNEIIKDEENHLGSLLFCLNLLDPNSILNIDAGAKGS